MYSEYKVTGIEIDSILKGQKSSTGTENDIFLEEHFGERICRVDFILDGKLK